MMEQVRLFLDAECKKPFKELDFGEVEIIDGITTSKELTLYAKHDLESSVSLELLAEGKHKNEIEIPRASITIEPRQVIPITLRFVPNAERNEKLSATLKTRARYRV